MTLTAARTTGPLGRPRWRSSILGGPTRSNSLDGMPNHAISPARARNGHGSCGKRSADSAFPTSSHSRCYGTHINESARRGTSERSGQVVKSSVHETMGSLLHRCLRRVGPRWRVPSYSGARGPTLELTSLLVGVPVHFSHFQNHGGWHERARGRGFLRDCLLRAMRPLKVGKQHPNHNCRVDRAMFLVQNA